MPLDTPETDQFPDTQTGTPKTRYERELARTPLTADPPEGHTPESWREMRAAFNCLGDEFPAETVDIWPADGEPVLYFITPSLPGAIKIGISTRLRQRVTSLQTVVPYGLGEVWYCPGGRTLEKALHALFAEHRLPGEWFKDTPSIRAKIVELGCFYAPAHLIDADEFEIRPAHD